MKSIIFCKRTVKELLRDPLSYVFCLGFPIVMLIIMSVVNESIPEQANMDVFQIQNLAPGIAVFGLAFVMLFTCLQVSKDRSTAFLTRLYASPMKPVDFILGYTMPLLVTAIMQSVATFASSIVIGRMTGYTFQPGNILLCILAILPTAFLFIGFGLLFGSLLNDKAAPGICSLIITAATILGGIWMDIDSIGGILAKVCKALPFYHGVEAARLAMRGQYAELGKPFLIILLYGAVIYFLSILAFRRKMRSDIK